MFLTLRKSIKETIELMI